MRTQLHCETTLRSFYDFHLEEGVGPVVNPFPLDRARRLGRAHAGQRPGQPFRLERQGRYRPSVPGRAPGRIPQSDAEQARRSTAVDLGIPTFRDIAERHAGAPLRP
ncbi:hypothetical protein AB0N07_21485 [Streptomyces sp. NPDC051172]|uniref:hypothetical protein n=1 Tax=Streptomyces sp. NPDC051172 TaxID=3155796 RepID=UPI003412A7C3